MIQSFIGDFKNQTECEAHLANNGFVYFGFICSTKLYVKKSEKIIARIYIYADDSCKIDKGEYTYK